MGERHSGPSRARNGGIGFAAALVAFVSALVGTTVATGPVAAVVPAARIVAEHRVGAREVDLTVQSSAMRKMLVVKVIPAASGRPAPTLYLLNGAAGGDAGSSWFDQTDIRTFFAHENVNVVVPMGGAASYFTDWRSPDPKLGYQKWATYLTGELPTLIDRRFAGNGRNAIAGISMAGTSVFQLSIHAPHLYRAIGSYSGCAQTSDPIGQTVVNLVVDGRGGGNTLNMWGPPTDPAWQANDPMLHVEDFRGKSIYVSNGTGTPGRYDTLTGPGINGSARKLAEQVVVGAVIESATDQCAHNLERRMRQAGIPATFHFYAGGTHSWPYWQDELHRSWPQFRAALASASISAGPSSRSPGTTR